MQTDLDIHKQAMRRIDKLVKKAATSLVKALEDY